MLREYPEASGKSTPRLAVGNTKGRREKAPLAHRLGNKTGDQVDDLALAAEEEVVGARQHRDVSGVVL